MAKRYVVLYHHVKLPSMLYVCRWSWTTATYVDCFRAQSSTADRLGTPWPHFTALGTCACQDVSNTNYLSTYAYTHIVLINVRDRFLSYLITHMYLANPQARVGGLHSLRLSCLNELRCKGLTGTSAFKTAAIYGSQMIVTCPGLYK